MAPCPSTLGEQMALDQAVVVHCDELWTQLGPWAWWWWWWTGVPGYCLGDAESKGSDAARKS